MNKHIKSSASLLAPAILALSSMAEGAILGSSGVTGGACPAGARCFNLTARPGHIALGDGNSLLAWGYSEGPLMQYPGTTLIVNQGETVQVTLSNALSVPVSIVFPGQQGVSATGGTAGLLTNEVPAGGAGSVTYSFTAAQAGTYLYQSGTQPEVQIEMGLVGALIVRPTGFDEDTDRRAYSSASSAYDREFLYFLSDMDRCAHEAQELIEQAKAANTPPPDPSTHNPPDTCSVVDPAGYSATLWFINGRNGPDTMLAPSVGWMPSQPYNALTRMHPGDRVLMRIVGGGRDLHPFHHHGNNTWLIARDGRALESGAGAAASYPDFVGIPEFEALGASVPDQAISNFTIQIVPGNTYDALFTWTGKGLNWDIYGNLPGHTSADCGARVPGEDPGSHCKDFPVTLPEQQAMTFGGFWSGSPHLGTLLPIPPLQGGLNPEGGYTFMWHSHTERELTNDDIFPGGMMTMLIIEAPNVDID